MAKLVTTIVVVLGFLVLTVVAKETPEKQPELELSGKVSVDGKLLEEGRILFYKDDSQILGCLFKWGKFTINNPPLGIFSVTVDGSNVSKRYSDYKTSPLKIEIREPIGAIDIALPGKVRVSRDELRDYGDYGGGGYGGEGE